MDYFQTRNNLRKNNACHLEQEKTQRTYRKQELMTKLVQKLKQLKKITMSLDDLVHPGALDTSSDLSQSSLEGSSSISDVQDSDSSSGIEINFKNSESLEISTSDESLSVSPYKVFKPPQCPYRKKHKHTIPRHAKSNAISESHCHCLDCGKGFTSSFDLLHHQKFMRLENNDWVCGCCGARFAERFQFYGRSDDDEFLNEECIHCQSQFATKTELNVHIITKHFTEKLQCDIPDCSSQFKQTDHFIRHLKTTHRQLDRKLVKNLLQKVLVLVPDYDQLKYV